MAWQRVGHTWATNTHWTFANVCPSGAVFPHWCGNSTCPWQHLLTFWLHVCFLAALCLPWPSRIAVTSSCLLDFQSSHFIFPHQTAYHLRTTGSQMFLFSPSPGHHHLLQHRLIGWCDKENHLARSVHTRICMTNSLSSLISGFTATKQVDPK